MLVPAASGIHRRLAGLLPALAFACVFTAAANAATVEPSTLAADRLEASYNSGDQFVRDPELDALLARIGARLQEANPEARCLPLRLHALDAPLPYSFTLANGAHYVSTGLIAQLQSEAELAAVIALPLAALCRGDAGKLQAGEHQRMLGNLVPNLLVVTLTAGLGAKSLGRAQEKETEEQRIRLRDASDAVALQWLTAAGFEATAADAALRRLVDGLATIDRSGTGEFSRPLELMSRRDALRRSASGPDGGGAEAVRTPAAPAAADAGFRALSRRYALALARADVNSHPSSLPAWLARIDRRDGPSGYTAYLRAELARRNSGTDEGATAAIRAYETCVGFADAPVAAYRELGFLLQRTGASDRARQAFETYLRKAPTAVDAPIIRSYLEPP